MILSVSLVLLQFKRINDNFLGFWRRVEFRVSDIRYAGSFPVYKNTCYSCITIFKQKLNDKNKTTTLIIQSSNSTLRTYYANLVQFWFRIYHYLYIGKKLNITLVHSFLYLWCYITKYTGFERLYKTKSICHLIYDICCCKIVNMTEMKKILQSYWRRAACILTITFVVYFSTELNCYKF